MELVGSSFCFELRRSENDRNGDEKIILLMKDKHSRGFDSQWPSLADLKNA
jgi:hypothetical protein